MVNNKNKDKNKNNSSNSLVFGGWLQAKMLKGPFGTFTIWPHH